MKGTIDPARLRTPKIGATMFPDENTPSPSRKHPVRHAGGVSTGFSTDSLSAMMEKVLAGATLLGGLAAIWYFWERIIAVFAPISNERRKLKRDFDAVRRSVLYCGLTNHLPVELRKLRQFMIDHGLVESSPSCREFFAKWLTHPMVVEGIPAVNSFSHDEIHQIERELVELAL